MSLSHATFPDGSRVDLPPAGPYTGADLLPLRGKIFDLPCEDPWLARSGTEAHAYLDGAGAGWTEYPEWMDVVDVESPAYDIKAAERDLYLHWWADHVNAKKVLDVGCGVGRMTIPFLDRGATVIGVDGDLESLRRCAWHAAGRPGRLDLHWSSVHHLPNETDFDVVLATEVLCYVPEIESALSEIIARLKPGGVLLISMEGRWGWATAEDAPAGAITEALEGTGILHLPGDRWVRTVDGPELTDLLTSVGFEVESLRPCFYLTDGPLEACLPASASLEDLISYEEAAAKHPVWGPLNRAWIAVARKPLK